MDLEWAKDGHTGELFIVQARPETVQSRKNPDVLESYQLSKRSTVLTSGRSVGAKIATGECGSSRARSSSASFRRAKCSSPTRPIPTGSPS
jgi:pyruvate, water dikinase